MGKTIDKIRVLGNNGDYSMIIGFENSPRDLNLTIWNWRDFDDAPNDEEPYVIPNGVVVQLLSDILPTEDAQRLWVAIDKGDAIDEYFYNMHGQDIRELY